MKKFFELAECFCISVITVTVVILFMFRVIVVEGDSMTNTLHSGEKIITCNFLYTPKRGDIVVTDGRVYNNRRLIKRVIATGGDILKIDYSTGNVYVNGAVLEESYIREKINADSKKENIEITVPDGYVFLMGDNRNGSLDSRSQEIGIVSEKDILGKAVFRIYPFSKTGKVK